LLKATIKQAPARNLVMSPSGDYRPAFYETHAVRRNRSSPGDHIPGSFQFNNSRISSRGAAICQSVVLARMGAALTYPHDAGGMDRGRD
jgi:hypothetical protein